MVADVDEKSGTSRDVSVDELINIHPGFKSTNGCQWARSDTSPLGKQYQIKRTRKGNKVSSVQLIGINDSISKYRGIKKEIVKSVKSQRCSILDIDTNIECDHKNGRYDNINNISTSTQKEEDFQALCKTANDAKRSHCKKCQDTGKRFCASALGYCVDFTEGDEYSDFCDGCYWYDIKEFNRAVSANAAKPPHLAS
jgi:hypothetical protein